MSPLLIMGGIQAGTTLLSGLFQADTAAQQQKEANKLAQERNKANLRETARQIGEINRQRTVMGMQVNQALQHVGAASAANESDLNVAFAVADSIGSTSQVLLSDVDRQASEAAAVTKQNYETEQFNLNSQIDSLVNAGISQYTAMTYGARESVLAQTGANVLSSAIGTGVSAYTVGLFGSSASGSTRNIMNLSK